MDLLGMDVASRDGHDGEPARSKRSVVAYNRLMNEDRAPLSKALVGTWMLLSREDRTREGRLHPDPGLGDDPIAILTYDGAGNFAAQFMKRDRLVSAPAA